MKKTLIILLLFAGLQTFGQVTDNFSDGDFTSNPVWTPDNGVNWTILNNQLRSNSGIASSSFFITTPSTKAVNAEWDFLVNLQFNTSGANYVDIYLTSEQANLSSIVNNGYFVRLGGTPDEISLYKMSSGTTSILINGTDAVTNSSNSLLRVKIIRDASNQWILQRDATGGTTFVTEGTAIDNSFTNSGFFGVKIQQSTASFFNKHFFDDFYVGDIVVENIPPTIQSIQVLNQTTLSVLYSEKLEVSSAQSLLNYTANNAIGNPISALLQSDGKTVLLTFSNSFPNGVPSELTISGIKDLAGNAISSTTQPLLYFSSQPAVFNDIVINEFFPDPSPQIGLPASEFVEIYNRSAKPFDLNGWKLSDPTTTATLPSFILLPGEYIILTSTSGTSDYSSLGKVIGLSNFPTLNNSNDAIKLYDASNQKIDSVNYQLAWYQDDDKAEGGWSLERLSPEVSTNEVTNWQASENVSGGTPGKQNSVLGKNPDSKPPQILNLIVLNEKEVKVEFDEVIESSSAQAISNYHVNNSIGNPLTTVLLTGEKSVQLTFQTPFSNGTDYLLSIHSVKDVAGNSLPDTEKSFRYFVAVAPKLKDILITEIMADPSPVVQLPEAEYIEIYNGSASAFDLAGWKLSDASTTATLPSSILLPGSFLILTSSSNVSKFSSNTKAIAVTSFPSLNNDGEPLVLKDATGHTIDSLSYHSAWYRDDEKKEGGWSLELIDPLNTCGEEDNWIASEDELGGTPGKINSVLASKPDLTGPKLEHVSPVQSNQLLFQFNEKLQTEINLSSFQFSPEIIIEKVFFTDLSLRQIQVNLINELTVRQLYNVHLVDIYDCAGNSIIENYSDLKIALPEAADSLDILINEILFNPRTGGVDFVELYNHSPKFINLKNLKLANYENGGAINKEAITDIDFLFAPGEYIVLTEDASILKNHYPQSETKKVVEVNLPSFPDDEGSVAVVNDEDRIIDHLFYSEKYHSALIKDEEGVSLERICFSQPTNAASNWRSANASSGYATPGFVNSNTKPDVLINDNEVSITPEIFSAGSVADDFVQVSYQFDESGQVANAKIYDQQGRSIKEICNNETIGYNGSFRWDGDCDNGSKARNGYYLVWFEVFNPNGKVKTFRKRVIVASR